MRCTLALFALLPLSAQRPATQPQFEVASVKLVTGRTGEAAYVRVDANTARVSYTNVTLALLISAAYGVDDENISGIPGAVASATYDVAATMPPHSSTTQVPQMLQRLLAERFQLDVRHEFVQRPAYDLIVGPNGATMTRTDRDSAGRNQILPGQIMATNANMETIAGMIARVVKTPVVDRTGLEGRFDFTLDWGPDETGPSIFTTIQEQHGLKLVSARAPVESIVVTHVERVPTEN